MNACGLLIFVRERVAGLGRKTLVLAVLQALHGLSHPMALQALLPVHNLTTCLLSGRPPSLCAWFTAHVANATDNGCSAGRSGREVTDDIAYRCMFESRCIALYSVPHCVGEVGFNFSRLVFGLSNCTQLVEDVNASMGYGLILRNGTGCNFLEARTEIEAAMGDEYNASRVAVESLPHFHPCAGALDDVLVDRTRDIRTRAGVYTSHVVVALSPRIGPVAGGVSVGVCGLGFTQANEAVSQLACRFTDGRNALDVPAVHVDAYQVRCIAPDFTRFAVGMPHNVSLELSTGRGASWTNNRVPFTYYSTRPAIDAFGRPMWGYDPTFTKAAWQVTFERNEFGSFAPELYPASGHALNEGRPSPWDAPRDPYHAQGPSAAVQPVELDAGDRMDPSEDLVVRTAQAALHGVEGSWGDRKSFLRAHALIPDRYRVSVVTARAEERKNVVENGVI